MRTVNIQCCRNVVHERRAQMDEAARRAVDRDINLSCVSYMMKSHIACTFLTHTHTHSHPHSGIRAALCVTWVGSVSRCQSWSPCVLSDSRDPQGTCCICHWNTCKCVCVFYMRSSADTFVCRKSVTLCILWRLLSLPCTLKYHLAVMSFAELFLISP